MGLRIFGCGFLDFGLRVLDFGYLPKRVTNSRNCVECGVPATVRAFKFGVQGAEFRIRGLGFGVRVMSLLFRIWGSGSRVKGFEIID